MARFISFMNKTLAKFIIITYIQRPFYLLTLKFSKKGKGKLKSLQRHQYRQRMIRKEKNSNNEPYSFFYLHYFIIKLK